MGGEDAIQNARRETDFTICSIYKVTLCVHVIVEIHWTLHMSSIAHLLSPPNRQCYFCVVYFIFIYSYICLNINVIFVNDGPQWIISCPKLG